MFMYNFELNKLQISGVVFDKIFQKKNQTTIEIQKFKSSQQKSQTIVNFKVPIIYFFDGRCLSRHKQEFLHIAGALMEHFLERIALLRHSYSNPNELRVLFSELTFQKPSRKCSIKALAKSKTSIYVLTVICLQ